MRDAHAGRAAHDAGRPRYDDVVAEVGDDLVARLEAAATPGVAEEVWIDPGIGFGKTLEHNLRCSRASATSSARVEVPVLSARRGSVPRRVLRDVAGEHGEPTAERRDDATLATTCGRSTTVRAIVRVHDVRPAARAVGLLDAMRVAART